MLYSLWTVSSLRTTVIISKPNFKQRILSLGDPKSLRSIEAKNVFSFSPDNKLIAHGFSRKREC